MTSQKDFLQYFKDVPKTGVIYVLEKATQMGYSSADASWANLGQGAPDTEPLSGNKSVNKGLEVNAENSEYAPVAGHLELRKKVADYYNKLYRSHSKSSYSYKNVCIAGGGRMALSRLVAAFGNINMGHFIPDYTAYEELLSAFKTFIPIPILLKEANQYKMPINELREEILGRGLSALLVSNPCNPTGQYLNEAELSAWVALSRELRSMFIFDEFYSHYIYDKKELISAAAHIDDVNEDPVVIINGLSKNWRAPGWRIGWVLGPESMIEKVSSVGSFMDGGAVHPLQEEAVHLINPEAVHAEAELIQNEFKEKRDYVLSRLKELGIRVPVAPSSTFYCWCDISDLPSPINNSDYFFEECLKEKVIVVPGEFFDVNPGKRRLKQHSRYKRYIRLSFGPKMQRLITGLSSIERVIKKFS